MVAAFDPSETLQSLESSHSGLKNPDIEHATDFSGWPLSTRRICEHRHPLVPLISNGGASFVGYLVGPVPVYRATRCTPPFLNVRHGLTLVADVGHLGQYCLGRLLGALLPSG